MDRNFTTTLFGFRGGGDGRSGVVAVEEISPHSPSDSIAESSMRG